jgi:hypothetical protein
VEEHFVVFPPSREADKREDFSLLSGDNKLIKIYRHAIAFYLSSRAIKKDPKKTMYAWRRLGCVSKHH